MSAFAIVSITQPQGTKNNTLATTQFAATAALPNWIVKTAAYTASSGDFLQVNTSNGTVSITLPANPTIGMVVNFSDSVATWNTNNLTVLNNGSNINGSSTALVCDVSGLTFYLLYQGGTVGWKAFLNSSSIPGVQGAPGNTTIPANPTTNGIPIFSSASGQLSDSGITLASLATAANLATTNTNVTNLTNTVSTTNSNLSTLQSQVNAFSTAQAFDETDIRYLFLKTSALSGTQLGMIDGIVDPLNNVTDINLSLSSGYVFNSSSGVIGAGPSDSYVKALIHFDGVNGSTSFTDVLGKTVTNNGGVTVSTTQSVFGGASALFNNGSLSMADTATLNMGTTNFTIECRIYPTALSGTIFTKDGVTNQSYTQYAMGINANGTINVVICPSPSTTTYTSFNSTGTVSVNTWSAVALERVGNVFTIYINGTASGTTTQSYNLTSNGQPLYLGPSNYAGYIDEFRISNGIARYGQNYTPATSAFLSSSNITLQSTSISSPVASPSSARVFLQLDSTSIVPIINTDLLAFFSRDGGTTFTQGSLSLVETLQDGTALYDTGSFSVSGQPSGNSTMTYKIVTANGKAIVITGTGMQVRP